MADLFKQLYQGQPGISATVVYTVPVGKHAEIRSISVVNASVTNDINVIIYINGITAPYQWARLTLDSHQFATWDGVEHLDDGGTIALEASTADAVSITISGSEVA